MHQLVEQAELPGVARPALVAAARVLIEQQRQRLRSGAAVDYDAAFSNAALAAEVARQASAPLHGVINATGVVLHTNLGRAPLLPAAFAAVMDVALGYSNLEFDIGEGVRGSRHSHVAPLLRELTGAAASVVVNNNAAATVLGIAALAAGREVIVSRGELIEIGGAFRLPDICAMSGARLVAVGTTNKTRLDDYRRAIGPATALLLKVHPSNFEQRGFVASVDIAELAALGKATGVATMMDVGSGCFTDAATQQACGLPPEPTVAEVAALVDLVSFSGDKLLGGPQAGILVGRTELIERARKHPWMRALRPDKLTLAALWATLQAYRIDGGVHVPVWAMLRASAAEVAARAAQAKALIDAAPAWLPGLHLAIVPSVATVGGGTMPTSQLPSTALTITADSGERLARAAAALRLGQPTVIGRMADGALWLDLRTVSDADLANFAAAVAAVGQIA